MQDRKTFEQFCKNLNFRVVFFQRGDFNRIQGKEYSILFLRSQEAAHTVLGKLAGSTITHETISRNLGWLPTIVIDFPGEPEVWQQQLLSALRQCVKL